MAGLVWGGAALAVLAAIALVVLALRARSLLSGQSGDPAPGRLTTLAALNGAILGLGLMGVGLMVVGLLL
jgi:hypothetical protein